MDRFQLAAARAMLGWSQKELSSRTNITAEAINRIERGEIENPRVSTIETIKQIFEENGIEFLDQSGVRFKSNKIREISGEDCCLKMFDDIFYYLKKDDELLLIGVDERLSPSKIRDAVRRIRKAGIKMRNLTEESNTYLMGELDEYRYLPKEYYQNEGLLVYGNKIASFLSDVGKVIIIEDKDLASSIKNLFNFIWSITKKPMETIADERF
jgi:transcriptional regulator with XRE-family HTH domain